MYTKLIGFRTSTQPPSIFKFCIKLLCYSPATNQQQLISHHNLLSWYKKFIITLVQDAYYILLMRHIIYTQWI
jgi:hypothetical protein